MLHRKSPDDPRDDLDLLASFFFHHFLPLSSLFLSSRVVSLTLNLVPRLWKWGSLFCLCLPSCQATCALTSHAPRLLHNYRGPLTRCLPAYLGSWATHNMYIQWRFPVIIDYLGHVLGRANASPTTPLGPLGRAEDTAKGEHGPRGTPFPQNQTYFILLHMYA